MALAHAPAAMALEPGQPDAAPASLPLTHDSGSQRGLELTSAGTAALGPEVRFAHDSYALDTATDLAKGLVLSGAITAGLEATLQRTRASGGSYSLASERTSAAFAAAPILASRYGWKAGVPAYTLAVMTGLGRMDARPQRASDVLAAATVGLVVGSAVAHRRSTQLMPEHVYMGKRGLGLKFGF